MKVFLPLLNSLDPTGWPLKVIPTSGWGFPSWKTINLINWQTCLALSGGPGLCKLWEPWSLASELRLTPRPPSPPAVDEREVLEKIIMPKNLLIYNRFFLLLCDKVASQHSPGHMGTDPFHEWPSQKSMSFPIICKPSVHAYLENGIVLRIEPCFSCVCVSPVHCTVWFSGSGAKRKNPHSKLITTRLCEKKMKISEIFLGGLCLSKEKKIYARQPFLFCCLEST